MSKYSNLKEYLKNVGKNKVKLTFKEIEDIINDKLPNSAYKYKAWWSNSLSHTQSYAWVDTGYSILDFEFGEYVIFKKENCKDGNIAFKCAYNDKEYKKVCSKDIANYNINIKKSLNCSKTIYDCNCYEKDIFKYYRMGAGWSNGDTPRKIKGAKVNKLAILTTVKPTDSELNRYIFGFLYIDGFEDEYETFIVGDEKLSLQIYKDIQNKMKFWNYYSNKNNPEEAKWGSGLFRYVDDEGIYDFLYDLINEYEGLIISKYSNNDMSDIEVLKSNLDIIENVFEKYKEAFGEYDKRKRMTTLLEEAEEDIEVNREYVVKTRIGQAKFRDKLLEDYSKCNICGMNIVDLLVASHIKPWSKCLEGEHLDKYNGFLLCPIHDALFDKGYISFDDNGKILISSKIELKNYGLLNLDKNTVIDLYDKNKSYLEFHREFIFIV